MAVLDYKLLLQIRRGAVGNFGLRVTAAVLNMLSGVLLARLLKAEGYGIYAYYLTIISVINVPVMAGLPNLIVRYVASYAVAGKWGLAKGLILRANQVVLMLSIVVAIGMAYAVYGSSGDFSPIELATLLFALPLLPFVALGGIREAILRAFGRPVSALVPEYGVRPTLFVLLLLGAYIFFEKDATPDKVMLFQLSAAATAFIVGVFLILRVQPNELKGVEPDYQTRAWVKSAIPFMLFGGVTILNKRLDVLMVGSFLESSDVGVYQVVVRMTDIALFIIISINSVITPMLAELYERGDQGKLQSILAFVARVSFFSTIPIVILLSLFGVQILELVFGPEFGRGFYSMVILSVGQLIGAALGSGGQLLLMSGNEKSVVFIGWLSLLVNFALNYILIPYIGINGAAIATVVSMVVWNGALAWWCAKIVSVNSTLLSG